MIDITFLIPINNEEKFNIVFLQQILSNKFPNIYLIDKKQEPYQLFQIKNLQFPESKLYLDNLLFAEFRTCYYIDKNFIYKKWKEVNLLHDEFSELINENIPENTITLCLHSSFAYASPKVVDNFKEMIDYLIEYFNCYVIEKIYFPKFDRPPIYKKRKFKNSDILVL